MPGGEGTCVWFPVRIPDSELAMARDDECCDCCVRLHQAPLLPERSSLVMRMPQRS